MKCHLIFPQKDGRTGVAIKEALISNGIEVLASDPTDMSNQDILNNGIGVSFTYDFVLISRTPTLLDLIKYIKRFHKDGPIPKIICWNTDKRRNMDHWGGKLLNLFKECDWIYTVAKGDVKRYAQLGIKARWLSQGVHTGVFDKDVTNDPKYECDVAFMGSYPSPLIGNKPVHEGRNELIEYVQRKCQEDGYSFRLYRPYDGTSVHGAEFIKACRGARVVLSHNGFAKFGPSPSVRLYEVLASKGNLIEEWSEGLEDFIGGLITYQGKENAWFTIKSLLVQEDAMLAGGMASYIARQNVLKNHLYSNRIQQIIGDIENAQYSA